MSAGPLEPAARPGFAIRLLGEVLAPGDLATAAAACVTVLARDLVFDRVSLGVPEGGDCRVIARSHVIDPDALSEANHAVSAAMSEAIEQGVSIVVTESTPPGPLVVRAHTALLRDSPGLVATVPLAVRGELVGAMTFQSLRARLLTPAELASLENLAALIAPVLQLMRMIERPWWSRQRDHWASFRSRLALEDSRRLRVGLAAMALVASIVLLLPLEDRVGAEARIEGEMQRVLVAPTDGYLEIAHVRAGDDIKRGQVLAELFDRDLLLDRDRLQSQLNQHETAYATSMARTDRAEAALDLSRAAEAQAELSLVESALSRSRILAPFDGVVIHGDLSQAQGAPVKQGETLFTVAPAHRFRLIIEIEERDIASVQVGQRGSLALSALPWDTLPLEIVRLTPLATAVENRNVFEVEARLLEQPEDLRPGLRGTARVIVGRAPLLWAWGGRVAANLRLTLWSWLA
jgi:multidrug resistance efflux pump